MLINLFVTIIEFQTMIHSFQRLLKLWIFLALMLINVPNGLTQEWNSARLTVLYGSSIPFNFNSLAKIKDGIEITTGTHIGISMADSAKVGHTLEGFILNFRSFNGQANIKGDVYTLPLNRIQVKAQNILGLGSGTTYGYKDLTTGWVPLFTYSIVSPSPWVNLDWSNHQLNLSFQCGVPVSRGGNGSLMGEGPDYYNVEIEFELMPTGPGF